MPKGNNTSEDDNVRLSAIDEDVLTVLLGRELYGGDILKDLNPGRKIPLKLKSLYPALNRLERKGLISWRWGDATEATGGARRKYYKVTGLGASVLNDVQVYRAMLKKRAWAGHTALGGA
ncbi:MAG: helix-turn-helix transcriptional regulator [Cyanobacteria bacterium P01_F01_bin.116]